MNGEELEGVLGAVKGMRVLKISELGGRPVDLGHLLSAESLTGMLTHCFLPRDQELMTRDRSFDDVGTLARLPEDDKSTHHPPLPHLAHIPHHRAVRQLRRTVPPPTLDANPHLPSNTPCDLLRHLHSGIEDHGEHLQRDGHYWFAEHRRDARESRSHRDGVLEAVL